MSTEDEAAFLRGDLNVCPVCRTLQPIKAGQWCPACYAEQQWAPFIKRRPKRPSVGSGPPRKPRAPSPPRRPRGRPRAAINFERRLSRAGAYVTEEQAKMLCRSYANVYKRRGVLKPQPCQRCGDPDVEMHHADYSQPLKVEWLCVRCHKRHHAEVSRETLSDQGLS